MNVKDVVNILNEKCPMSMAEPWDNVGLLVGDEKAVVKKVLVALDPIRSVINEALVCGADLIVTHHPVMFKPAKTITRDTFDGRIISTLLENKINLCAMHTNVDFYEKGPNHTAAKLLNLADVKTLVPHPDVANAGIGKIGTLPFAVPISLESLAEYVKKSFKADFVRLAGTPTADVHKVALVTGSGMDYVDAAIEQGADVLITGDIKYHQAHDAVERGIYLIDVGHFESEKLVINMFEKLLSTKLKNAGVELIKSKQENIFKAV